jgi:hypothetical protein
VLRCLLLACAAVTACKRGAKTPEEAYHRFVEAVRTKNPEQLYQTLDLPTRWSWMTIRRAHREAYDILLSNLPEGPGRDQATRRFEAGAHSESEAALFAEELTDTRWEELGRAIASAPAAPALTAVAADEQEARLPGGRALRFRRGSDGRWGYSGLSTEAEERKLRAMADLETIRSNAADQERAATRAGR